MRILQRFVRLVRGRFDAESKALFKNSTWFFLANANSAVCDFLRSVILGRGLGVEGFGIYILIITLVHTIQEFFNLNLGTAFIKFGAEYKSSNNISRLGALLKGCFILAGVTALASITFIILVSYFAYDLFISEPGLRTYIQVYAIAASLSFFDYLSVSLLKLYFKFRLNSVIKICLDLTELAVVATVVYLFPGDLPALFTAVVGILVIKGIVYNGAALWEMRDVIISHLRVKISEIGDDKRRISGFVVNNSVSRTLHTLIFSGDILLLGALAGPAEAGYYAIAKKLAFAVLRLTDPMTHSIYPQLATLVAQHSYANIKIMLKKVSTIFLLVIATIFFLVLGMNEWIMTSIYGEEFLPASTALVILVAASGVSAVFFWSTSLIFSLGRVDVRLKAYLLALVLGGSVAWFLIPAYGATGLAIAMLLAVTIMQSIFVVVCRSALRE
jgi:O-antigen/teichoic acid export membrane protein